jgi:hypothetical protein
MKHVAAALLIKDQTHRKKYKHKSRFCSLSSSSSCHSNTDFPSLAATEQLQKSSPSKKQKKRKASEIGMETIP